MIGIDKRALRRAILATGLTLAALVGAIGGLVWVWRR